MAKAENLNIILTAKTKDLEKKLKSSERRIQHFEKKSKKSLGVTTKAFNKLGVAAAGFAAALSARAFATGMRNALDGAVQIQNLSRLAGIATSEFQVLTLTANQFGIGQEKLADILKDVNDKFGDFTEANSGTLKDFFEYIAPKVNLTAAAFADMSSSEKLGAYINALRKANVNQSEMTFYMEAIASDSTALVAAFDNNGKAIDEMRVKAEKLGLILQDDFIENAKEAKLEVDLLSKVIELNLNRAFISLAPLLADSSDKLATFIEEAVKFGKSDTFKNIVKMTPVGRIVNALSEDTPEEKLLDVVKERQRLQGKLDAFMKNIQDLDANSEQQLEIDKTIAHFKEQIEKLNEPMKSIKIEIEANIVPNTDEIVDSAWSSLKDTSTPQTKITDSIKSEIADLVEKARLKEIGAKAVERERIELEKQAIIRRATPENLNPAISVGGRDDKLIKSGSEQLAEAQALGEAYEAAAIAASSILTPPPAIDARTEMERLVETMLEASPALIEMGVNAKGLEEIMTGMQGSIEDTMMAFVSGSESGKDAFKSMAKAMISDIFRIMVAKKMAGMITGFVGGLFGGSSIPVPGKASGGSVKAGQSYVTGEHGRELFVPNTDGRVLSAGQTKNAQSGGGGVTIIQNNTFSAGVKREELINMVPQIIDATKAAVQDAQSRTVNGRL